MKRRRKGVFFTFLCLKGERACAAYSHSIVNHQLNALIYIAFQHLDFLGAMINTMIGNTKNYYVPSTSCPFDSETPKLNPQRKQIIPFAVLAPVTPDSIELYWPTLESPTPCLITAG